MTVEDHIPLWEEYLHDRIFNQVLDLAEKYPDKRSLYIKFKDLENFDPEFAEALLQNPVEVLEAADIALRTIDSPMDVELSEAKVRITNLPSRIKARQIRDHHHGTLVALEGMVRTTTKAFTAITDMNVTCLRCGTSFYAKPSREKKYTCANQACDRQGPFRHNMELSKKVAKRIIQLQENPEGLRGGELPEAIFCNLMGDLVEGVAPGNRVVVNGIVKLKPLKSKTGDDTMDFEPYLDAVSVEVIEREFEEIEITHEDELKILDIARSDDVVDKIRSSIAPSIYGMDEVKEAISLQLVSSPAMPHTDGTTTRGDIHIMMIGDPGIAKSQLMRYVIDLSPRGVYTSGKGASGAGLTASAVKDEMTDGRWTIEAGALPMADMGVCAVDEIDKMDQKDRDALHEGLEQQRISVSKAGIQATLRCRCSVIAAANPKMGRFDRYEPIASQINMLPSLLSRFDLIYILYDIPEKDLDDAISAHILSVDMDDSVCKPTISPDLLRKYIAYARRNIFPRLTDDAAEVIRAYYRGVRGQYSTGKDQPVPTTARQLQGLIRLAKASARLRLSNEVREEDAMRAVKLTDSCLKKVGVDPETGKYDVGVIDTGMSKTQKDKTLMITQMVTDICKTNGIASLQDILDAAEEAGIDEDRTVNILERLRRDGMIIEQRSGFYKRV